MDEKMSQLIDELNRARQLARLLDNEMLLYLLDMAIIEASAKAEALNDNLVRPKTIHYPLLRII